VPESQKICLDVNQLECIIAAILASTSTGEGAESNRNPRDLFTGPDRLIPPAMPPRRGFEKSSEDQTRSASAGLVAARQRRAQCRRAPHQCAAAA
jgi:hypothetical protein